jgi:hypothetical protein
MLILFLGCFAVLVGDFAHVSDVHVASFFRILTRFYASELSLRDICTKPFGQVTRV